MQRLLPLPVPWQVSPSTPFVRLLASESTSDKPTQVVFVGHFALRDEPVAEQGFGFEVPKKASNPHEIDGEGGKSRVYSLVRLEFQNGLWARMSPSYSDREVLNPDEFDASLLPGSTPPSDLNSWLNECRSHWLKTGQCSDPGAYLVEQSEWIRQIGATNLTHYVIEGHDAYVEVLAEDWKWEELDQLPDWW